MDTPASPGASHQPPEHPFCLAGVMGWPVHHSRSPLIHNHWLRELGWSGAYVPLPVAPGRLRQALTGLKALGFAGCNLTLPHKVAAMTLLDQVDPLAQRIGAVNTVVVQADGSLLGLNTDAFGFHESLRQSSPTWRADQGPAVVLGAGGAARAVISSLLSHGCAQVRLVNRSPERAQALAADLSPQVTALPWSLRHEALSGANLLVQTTSLGMTGQDPLDVDLRALPSHATVCDIVYTPLRTPLLVQAQAKGFTTVDGLGMLLHQARAAFAAWFGVMPSASAGLRQAVEQTL